jgi:hypothetical protein
MEFFKYSLFSFTIFLDLEEIIFENFNISENNIINVELAKVLRYYNIKPKKVQKEAIVMCFHPN